MTHQNDKTYNFIFILFEGHDSIRQKEYKIV